MDTPRFGRPSLRAAFVVGALLIAACGSNEQSSGDTLPRPNPTDDAREPQLPANTDPPSPQAPTTDPPATDPAPEEPAPDCGRALQRGCESADVAELQELLKKAGFGALEADGIFGPATQAAFESFEEQCSTCRADGSIVVGGAEWNALVDAEPAVSAPAWPTVFNSWTGGGDINNSCWEVGDRVEAPPRPHIFFGAYDTDDGDAAMSMGVNYEMCILGFDPSIPVTLNVNGPAGTHTTTIRAGATADSSLVDVMGPRGPSEATFENGSGLPDMMTSLNIRLDDPAFAGRYVIDATQGSTSTTRNVVVKEGDFGDVDLRIITANDWESWNRAVPGSALRAVLVGFPPNSTVPLALYRGTENFRGIGEPLAGDGDGYDFEFLQELAPAAVGEQGWTYYDFAVPDLPANPDVIWDYCVATSESLRRFWCQPYVDAVFDMAQ